MRNWLRNRNWFELALFMALLNFTINAGWGFFSGEAINWIRQGISSLIYGLLMGGVLFWIITYDRNKENE